MNEDFILQKITELEIAIAQLSDNNIFESIKNEIDNAEDNDAGDAFLDKEPGNMIYPEESDDFNLNLASFFPRKTGDDKITIATGNIWVGEQSAVTIAETEITITANNQYIWIEYNFNTNTGSLATPSSTLPVSASPVVVWPLCKAGYSSGHAVISQYLWIGDIHLPGTWAN